MFYKGVIIMNELTTFAMNANIKPALDENGKPEISLANLSRGVKNLEKGKIKVDYTIAMVLNAMSKLDKEVFTNAGFDNFVAYCEQEFSYTKGHVYKLTKIAEKFLTIPSLEDFVGVATTSQETGLVAKDGRNVDIALNTNAVKGLQDKFGFPFSITQMQEMAFLDTKDIIGLIEENKVKASMSCSAIREVVKALKTGDETGKTGKKEKASKDKDGVISAKVSNDAERFQSIIDIISMVEMEIFNDSDITKDFVTFLQECVKNTNK